MSQRDVAGQIIYGSMDEVVIRKKADKEVQIGELLVVPLDQGQKYMFQVFDILYGSQISKEMMENIAGKMMEQGVGGIRERDIRNYILLKARNILFINNGIAKAPKSLPPSFSFVYFVNEEDFNFLRSEEGSKIGVLRSGNKLLDIEVKMNVKDWITHHIFIGATTGRGKSNLVKVMLWNELYTRNVGFLVIDPHDEYFGRANDGLNTHPNALENLVYYSPSPPSQVPNSAKLIINISSLRPWDFLNVAEFSEAQQNAMYLTYAYALSQQESWIDLLLQKDRELLTFIKKEGVQDVSIDVLRRKIINILGAEIVIRNEEGERREGVRYAGVFRQQENGVLDKILQVLEEGKKVIIDTSSLPTRSELLISSVIVNMLFERYKNYKRNGEIEEKARIAVLLEEAPRIINASPHNIFETIAREGRKFNIGIVAITQLPSLIPPEILANMNTKIILGMEMEKERGVVIGSAPQDLSKDGRIIASLDKGEGIITSIFTKFAVPFKADNFNEILKEAIGNKEEHKVVRRGFGNEE